MAASFTLVQLRYFTQAARSGSMTEAAKRLHVSQPALSAAIALLEADLGVALFERVPRRGIRLTRAGFQFYEDALALLQQADAMRDTVDNFADVISGTLRVGMYTPMAPFRAPSILQAFARRHPDVAVDVFEADHLELARLVRDGEVDVGIGYSMSTYQGLRTELLETIPPHAIVPASHHLARSGRKVRLAELASDPLVLLDLPFTSEYYLSLYDRAGVTPHIRFRVHGYETVRGLVARGFGVSLLNQRLGHSLTYSGIPVVTLELEDDLPGLEVLMLHRSGEAPTQRVAAFAGTCRGLFGAAEPVAAAEAVDGAGAQRSQHGDRAQKTSPLT